MDLLLRNADFKPQYEYAEVQLLGSRQLGMVNKSIMAYGMEYSTFFVEGGAILPK